MYLNACTHLEKVDGVLGTEGLDELDVLGLLAVGGENAELGLTPGKIMD